MTAVGNEEDDYAFLDDFTSDLIKLGNSLIGIYKRANVSKNDSCTETLNNLQNVVADLEAKSSKNLETLKRILPKISAPVPNLSPYPIQNSSSSPPSLIKNSSSSNKTKFDKFKRVVCSLCGKLIVECFLRRHMRISHFINDFQSNNFENNGSIDFNQRIKIDASTANLVNVSPKWPTNKNYDKYGRWKYRFGKYSRKNCTICSKSIMECFFPKHSRMHERIAHEKSMNVKVSCKVCNRTIKQINISGHMEMYHGSKNQEQLRICKICSQRINVGHYNRHMWSKHQISCKSKENQNQTYLSKNKTGEVAKLQNEKIVTCYVCMKLKTMDTIQKHFLKAHCRRDLIQGNNSPKVAVKRRQPYESDDAQFMQPSRSMLSTHERCNLCHEFVIKGQFNNHMKTVHSGIGFRYKCSICQNGFMRLRGCKVHIGHAHKKQGGKPLPIIIKPIKQEIEDPLENLLNLSN